MKTKIILLILIAAIISISWVMVARADQVTLAWDPVETATGYKIFQRASGSSYDYENPAWTGTQTTCTIKNLASGITYHFVARAYNETAESGNSNEVTFKSPAQGELPGPVSGVKLLQENGKMFVITDPMDGDKVDYFDVELDGEIDRTDPQRDGDQARCHHEMTGITMGDHTVRVRAGNEWGEDVWSPPFDFVAELPGPVSGVGLSED